MVIINTWNGSDDAYSDALEAYAYDQMDLMNGNVKTCNHKWNPHTYDESTGIRWEKCLHCREVRRDPPARTSVQLVMDVEKLLDTMSPENCEDLLSLAIRYNDWKHEGYTAYPFAHTNHSDVERELDAVLARARRV